MEVLELRMADHHRNIEWPSTLEEFLEGARSVGHVVVKVHTAERWLVFDPMRMTWCEVGRAAVAEIVPNGS